MIDLLSICILGIFTFTFARWWERVDRLVTRVSCRCGARQTWIVVVDAIDEQRMADTLTENCFPCKDHA